MTVQKLHIKVKIQFNVRSVEKTRKKLPIGIENFEEFSLAWDVIKYAQILLKAKGAEPENYWANTSGTDL